MTADSTPWLLGLSAGSPVIDPDAFVAPSAVIVGNVRIGARASIWYASVSRGDAESIQVGADSNIQDGCVLHADPGAPLTVGERVTVGHRVVLHGCTIEDDVLVGMGSIVMNYARVGRGSLVGAGALLPQGTVIPPGSLVLGSPGKVVRPLTEAEQAAIKQSAQTYAALAAMHRVAAPAT
jgi:carbonic anhydrase/acetyltransferase-like protein (isoleucine patch superfamily)